MRENYVLHKLHSLSGIIPVGFYMAQHLLLNSFSLAGPSKFNGVIGFFSNMPQHVLLLLELVAIWIPLAFHAVYGLFIVARNGDNYSKSAYKYRENRYYRWQRWSGVLAFFFLCFHVTSTTGFAKARGHLVIEYDAWHSLLTHNGYVFFAIYALGMAACSYHLAYGIWNFCIRWGITISEASQEAMAKVSAVAFVLLTVLGVGALYGFINPVFQQQEAPVEARSSSSLAPASNAYDSSAIRFR